MFALVTAVMAVILAVLLEERSARYQRAFVRLVEAALVGPSVLRVCFVSPVAMGALA
jgi:ABC-type tungstate transport system substrate-binding protein